MGSEDKTNKMQDIIQQLESLTKKILEKNTPISLVRRVWEYARECFFEEEPAPSKDILQRSIFQVLESVSTILPFINDLQRGDSDERKLAARVLEGIAEYNRIVDLMNLPQVDASSAILNRKIELPRTPLMGSVKFTFDKGKSSLRSVFEESLPSQLRFSVHEEDLFRMKAISLLKDSIGLKPAISAVRNAPIQKLWDNAVSQDFVHARQTVCTFPGEVRILTGVFQCKSTHVIASLVDVKCTLSVHQTGYPAASQYTGGLTLSKAFLDSENIPELKSKQHTLAFALLPEGKYYQKAKDLIQLRRDAFNLNKESLSKLLKDHSTLFVTRGLIEQLSEAENATIHSFYEYCSEYDLIADVHYWISQKLDNEYYTPAQLETNLPLFNKPITDYIKLIYTPLRNSLERISLKSELEPFDSLLRSIAHYQQQQFFLDFEHDIGNVETMCERMHHHLDYEISLLESIPAAPAV